MKKSDKSKSKSNEALPDNPAPDNLGSLREIPKNVDQAAAESNRDVGKLQKHNPKGKKQPKK